VYQGFLCRAHAAVRTTNDSSATRSADFNRCSEILNSARLPSAVTKEFGSDGAFVFRSQGGAQVPFIVDNQIECVDRDLMFVADEKEWKARAANGGLAVDFRGDNRMFAATATSPPPVIE